MNKCLEIAFPRIYIAQMTRPLQTRVIYIWLKVSTLLREEQFDSKKNSSKNNSICQLIKVMFKIFIFFMH